MQSKTLILAAALAALPAGAAFAQSATPAEPATAEAPNSPADSASSTQSSTAPSTSSSTTSSTSADAAASTSPSAGAASDTAPTALATREDLKAGATVYDSSGATVGTIQSVTATGAVVAAGKLRAEVPTASFAKNARGLVIGISKAEFEAAVTRAKS